MKKMNIPLMGTLLILSIVVCPILYFTVGPTLDEAQLEVLKILGIIVSCSAAFCFVVGELTGNNSQMDKLWSLLPIVYTWVIAPGHALGPPSHYEFRPQRGIQTQVLGRGRGLPLGHSPLRPAFPKTLGLGVV